MELFEWEDGVLRAWCARDAEDRPAYVTCGLSVPRQNGKNAILEAFEVYQLAVCGAHILHTAHRVKTAKKSFQRLVKYFKDERRHPELSAMVENIRYTNGEEGIYLSNGGSVEFSARSRAGARGFDDIQIVVFDEAQDLTDDQLSAVMYTLAASSTGDRQMIFTGTPPDESSPGTVFARTREAATTSPANRTCWFEWGVEDMPPKGSTFADVLDLVYETNPSMGYTLDEEFTETEFANADLLGFSVERLGYWIKGSAQTAIPPELWAKTKVEEPPAGGKRAFGVKFSPDGQQVALAGCRWYPDAPDHVQLLGVGRLADGIGWITDFIIPRAGSTACVVVDGRNGADALLDALKGEFPRQALLSPGTRGVVAASTMFAEALRDGRLTHWASDGQQALDASVATSVKRPIGSDGGWGFGGDASAPAEAAALAYWGDATTKRDPDGGCVLL